jgi:hypothetical protein
MNDPSPNRTGFLLQTSDHFYKVQVQPTTTGLVFSLFEQEQVGNI